MNMDGRIILKLNMTESTCDVVACGMVGVCRWGVYDCVQLLQTLWVLPEMVQSQK
jgi:hypothetical protein